MKVICIKEPPNKVSERTRLPFVIRVGNEYTVIEFLHWDRLGYRLAEDELHTYQATYFAPLSSIDETEFERNYNKELA